MSNWCENDLWIEGDKKEVEECLKSISGENGCLDFNKIIPYLQRFRDIDNEAERIIKAVKGMSNDDEKLWLKANGYNIKSASDFKDGYNSGGYEWCIGNWGTKWNAYNPKIFKGGGNTKITFSTAWSPPLPIIKKLSEMFPKLTFTIEYYENGTGFQGVYSYKDNERRIKYYA